MQTALLALLGMAVADELTCGVLNFEEVLVDMTEWTPISSALPEGNGFQPVWIEAPFNGINHATLFDSSVTDSEDPDLHTDDQFNILIIQEDPATRPWKKVWEPNDKHDGGIIYFDFSGTAVGTPVILKSLKFIDIDWYEGNSSVILLDEFNNTLSSIAVLDQFNESALENNNILEMDIDVPDVMYMQVVLTHSGAVDDITLCLPANETNDDTVGGGGGLDGDPHVHTADGHVVNIYLPVGVWSGLLSSPRYALFGRVFGKPEDRDKQWFDAIALTDVVTGKTIVNATLHHGDDGVGTLGDADELQYFELRTDDAAITKVGRTEVSSDVSITVSKMATSMLRGIRDDNITVVTPDFTLEFNNARETNRAMYSSFEEQMRLTHIDLHFREVHHKQDMAGPLAELMFDKYQPAGRSKDAWKMTSMENAQSK